MAVTIPPGFTDCEPCESNGCKLCDSDKSLCQGCYDTHELFYDKCFEKCGPEKFNYFVNGPASQICENCDKNCLECTGTSDNCTSCRSIANLDNSSISGGECQYICKSGFFFDMTSDLPTCTACISNCKSCQNTLTCIECDTGKYFYDDASNNRRICFDSCPSNKYLSGQQCIDCHSTCKSCEGSGSSDCKNCHSGYFFHPDPSDDSNLGYCKID